MWGVWCHIVSGITIASEADLCTWSVRNEVDAKNLKIGWHACLNRIPYLAMSVQHRQNSYHSLNSSLHCKMVAPYPPYATRYGHKEYGAIQYPSEVAMGTVRTWLRSHRPGYGHHIYGTVSTHCTGYGAQPYYLLTITIVIYLVLSLLLSIDQHLSGTYNYLLTYIFRLSTTK